MTVPSSRTVVLAAAAICPQGFNATSIQAVAGDTAREYGISLGAVGLTTTALILVHTVLNVPAGRLADRLGARRIVLAGLAWLLAANLLGTIAAEPWLLFTVRGLAGVASAVTFVGSIAYMRAVGGSATRQGWLGGASLGASGLPIAIVPQLEPLLGWRAPFVATGVLALAALAVFVLSPANEILPTHVAPDGEEVRRVIADPRLYRIAVLHMGSMGLAVVCGSWIATLLSREGGASARTAGLVGSLALLIGLLGRPVGGWVVHRPERVARNALRVAFVVGAGGTALMALEPSLPWAALGAVLVGTAAGIPFGSAAHAAGALRPEAPGAAFGVVNMMANAVILVGAPLLGKAFSFADGGRIGFGVLAALWLAAALAVPNGRLLGLVRPAGAPARA